MPLVTVDGKKVVPTVIADKPLDADASRLNPVVNSATEETVHYFESADAKAADQACNAAQAAFQGGAFEGGWKRATAVTRRDILWKVADLFEERAEELKQAQKDETSCDDGWATNNVVVSVKYIREAAACCTQIKGDLPAVDQPGKLGFIFKEPVGPVLVIPPWNGALVLASRAITSALAAGCTVVLKASELSPLTHTLIVDLYREAGLDQYPGAINSLSVGRKDAAEITEKLIAHPYIRKIEFIGSPAIGRIIGATAAKYLKPCLMELGGKCPAVIFDDANLQQAATLCAKGAFLHHGQICFSTERIIVQRKVADKFQELLIKVAQDTGGGTAVHSGIASHAYDVLEDAKQKGCKFIYGSAEYQDDDKKAVKPALVQVDPKTSPDELRIVDEETFGPSASVYIVDTDEEAITVANKSAYGLNATVHTTNLERGLRAAREIECGQVHINSITVYTSPFGPQGGRSGRQSGWGRQNAMWGIEEYLDEKFITYTPTSA
ncbi:hypothetical protein MBLNU457_7615t1 [Dothideomycetes sp. NU457]